jgi:hypothetical protein
MSDSYTKHADICGKFYDLSIDSAAVADFVFERSGAMPQQEALFVGGMFGVASSLIQRGLNLTVIDYTEAMVALGKERLPSARVIKADLKQLPFQREFDLVFVVGRVFTHMISDADLTLAILGCRNALRVGGKLFADNYEDSRIQKTTYFNGTINCRDATAQIIRKSSTERISDLSYVVRWNAEYSGEFQQKPFHFFDSMSHRAFSRSEFAEHLISNDFEIIKQGDNFDETSFYTLATFS